MTRPTATPMTRAQPDHWEEHAYLAQHADVDKPQGVLGYTQGSATGVSLSATAYAAYTLTSLAIKANRFYLLTVIVRAYQTGSTAGAMNLRVLANGGLIASVYTYLPASNFWSNITWSQPYVLTSDTTVTFVANLTGPTSSQVWTDRGGGMRLDDRGKARGKQ